MSVFLAVPIWQFRSCSFPAAAPLRLTYPPDPLYTAGVPGLLIPWDTAALTARAFGVFTGGTTALNMLHQLCHCLHVSQTNCKKNPTHWHQTTSQDFITVRFPSNQRQFRKVTTPMQKKNKNKKTPVWHVTPQFRDLQLFEGPILLFFLTFRSFLNHFHSLC